MTKTPPWEIEDGCVVKLWLNQYDEDGQYTSAIHAGKDRSPNPYMTLCGVDLDKSTRGYPSWDAESDRTQNAMRPLDSISCKRCIRIIKSWQRKHQPITQPE